MDNAPTVTAVVAIGVAVMVGGIAQTDWKHKWLTHGMIGLGVLIILIGALFPWLGNWAPRFERFVTEIATNPVSWFATLVLLLSAHLARRRAPQEAIKSAETSAPSKIDDVTTTVINLQKDTNNRLSKLEANIQKQLETQTEINRSLDGMIGRIDDKADKIALTVHANTQAVREEITNLSERTKQRYNLFEQAQSRLCNAIRARDAEAIIKDRDKAVVELGIRLLGADDKIFVNADFPARAWIADYMMWERAVSEIDSIIGHWQPHYKRLLDLNRRDLEKVPQLPPASINSDPTIVIRSKTVCVVQERYTQDRTNILEYFNAKIRDSLS